MTKFILSYALPALFCCSLCTVAAQDLLIKNGTIVNHDTSFRADILIRGEKIIALALDLEPGENTTVIDASDMEVLPGGIDPHVHISGPFVDDFASGSKAALAGGITTVGDMTFPNEGQSLPDRIAEVESDIDTSSLVDVMIHPVFITASEEDRALVPQLASRGYTSLKIFTILESFEENVEGFTRLIESTKNNRVLPMIHCEDLSLIRKAQEPLIAEGKTSMYYFAESRPIAAEVQAVEWAIQQSEEMDAPVYIVHLSSADALEHCRRAQQRDVAVFVETRPMYLFFTADKFKEDDGPLFTGMPPLRSKQDIDALWRGLSDGSIHVLATDHAPWTREQKMSTDTDITGLYPGSSNLQLMLPMLYSEGVLKGRLSLERFVAVTSTNAAKLFGLYPRKGVITEGADADIVIWDKHESKEIDYHFGYSKSGYSIYKGYTVTGWPKYTIRRGEILVDDGMLTQLSSGGLSLERARWQSFKSD